MTAYFFFRIFEIIFLAFPEFMQKGFILALAKIVFIIDFKRKKIIKANLDLTIKDKISQETYNNVLKSCHINLALVLLQVLRSSKINLEQLAQSVEFENEEIVQTALNEGKRIIFISAHYGNWELGATALSALISPVTAIHKKMNNTYFDNYLMKSRTKFKMNMAEKKGAIKQLIKALKKGNSISMLIDQNVNPKDGIYIKFLGKQATQTAAPAFLARKFNAIIIPLFINTKKGNEHIITFYNPIITAKTEDEKQDIFDSTQAQADLLSKIILEHPEPWFWCHKRWKSAYKDIYS